MFWEIVRLVGTKTISCHAIHADGVCLAQEHAREVRASELVAFVCVERVGPFDFAQNSSSKAHQRPKGLVRFRRNAEKAQHQRKRSAQSKPVVAGFYHRSVTDILTLNYLSPGPLI
jgi:hypothetical protein